jgi:crotonobetainyl-CoA:carnitine CoA-transferase CaiB-like acyl-CoA transferase
VGFGAHFEALSGLTAIRGYADSDPTTITGSFHMDQASGSGAAFAVMMALRARKRTGRGCLIEFAQAENVAQQIGELYIDASRTGRRHEPVGNRHRIRAPQGCYPCAGVDRWVVISVGSEEEWLGLRRAMGNPDWAADRAFATLAGRCSQHDVLDNRISEWTQGFDCYEAFHRCQAEGVPAGPVMDEADAYSDPHLRARGFFRAMPSPHTGTHDYPSHTFTWTGPPMRWERGAPGLGEDNEYVYRQVLGLDDHAYEKLVVEGHIAASYLAPDGSPL